MSLDARAWFTEIHDSAGCAFSLKTVGKLHDVQSPYQRVEVYETEQWGNLMTLDGLVMLTQRDNYIYHEMMTHPVLFTHPSPQRVLIIGGGDCGTLQQVLKHPGVNEVTQVDIDAEVTRASETYFPELCTANTDPRAALHFDDGVKWVADADDERYDVIIVDSTDPIGPGEGLFSFAFYQNCQRILASNGLFIQQSESPLSSMDILRKMYKALRQAPFIDVMTLFFPQPVYPTGWWSATMAAKDMPITDFRQQDAETLPFTTEYYTAAVHRGAMAAPANFYRQLEA